MGVEIILIFDSQSWKILYFCVKCSLSWYRLQSCLTLELYLETLSQISVITKATVSPGKPPPPLPRRKRSVKCTQTLPTFFDNLPLCFKCSMFHYFFLYIFAREHFLIYNLISIISFYIPFLKRALCPVPVVHRESCLALPCLLLYRGGPLMAIIRL